MPAHSINSSTNWSHPYYFEALEQERSHYLEPFRFDLIPESLDVGATKPAKMKFEMDIWLEDQEENNVGEDKDPVWTVIARSAEEVAGTVTVDGSSSRWYCKKLRVEDRTREGRWLKCFTLETRSPLEIRKQGREMFNLVLDITFQLGGSVQDQITRLLYPAFPVPTPRPGSSYDDSVSLVSQPPNLAFRIDHADSSQYPHVWVQEDKLAAASAYLADVVSAVAQSEDAFLRVDDYLDLNAVEDDSDEEEDTRRYNLFKERQKSGDEDEDRRSEAPEPAENKSDGDELQPPAKRSKTNPYEGSSDEGGSDEDSDEDQEIAQAASLPIWPAIMDTRAPQDISQVIGVANCALSRLQAVIVWIVTGRIVFAPLSADGKKKRTAFIESSIKNYPKRPVPVSPRSVYRLAERFQLDKLASLAINDFKRKLTYKNAAAFALHIDCKLYSQIEKLVHDYVRNNYDSNRQALNSIELREDYQSILYAKLMKPIGGRLSKSRY